MDSRGRNSNSSHSSDQFNLYGAARDRTHYQRANAFISNAFSFLGRENFDAYKYYDDENASQSPILAANYSQQYPNQTHPPQQQYPSQQQYPPQPQFGQHPQQPYPRRMSDSSPGSLQKPDKSSGNMCLLVVLVAVIVFLLLAIVGVILGVIFGIVLKKSDYEFTSTMDTKEPWHPNLSNKGSAEYQNLTEKMKNSLTTAFAQSQLKQYSKPKQEIQGFHQSSSGSQRKKRDTATTVCTVRTSFSSKETPSVAKFKEDFNRAVAPLIEYGLIDLNLAALDVVDTTKSDFTTTTTQATTIVSITAAPRTTPAPVNCTAAATAGVNAACSVYTGNVGFPNLFGHVNVAETSDSYAFLKAIVDTNCMAGAERFICSLLYTPCVNSKLKFPCRKYCTEFVSKCKHPLDCSIMPDSDDPSFCVASDAQLAVVENAPPYNFTCPSGQALCGIEPNCFATSKRCDGILDCPDGFDELECNLLVQTKCDFETDLCSFDVADASNHFQWRRQKGPSSSAGTGPFIDHTKRDANGSYMYAEASDRYYHDQSVVWTPGQAISTESCLQFFYHMRGRHVDKLEVLLNRSNAITIPWFQTGDRKDNWLLGRVKLTASSDALKIGFRATMTGEYEGDIAVDDITIKKEACKDWNCETDEKRIKLFSCGNSNCISKEFQCNGQDDCGNYNDERDCVCTNNQFKCGIGMCIESRRQCDGVIDCPDKADETGCKCPKGQILCADNSTCIMREWQCDRQQDCPGGDDEKACRTCSSFQWQCKDYSCISRNNRCDGTTQCLDGSDEENCVQLNSESILIMTSQSESYPVCYTPTESSRGSDLCKELGLGTWISSTPVIKANQQYIHIASGNGSMVSRALVNTSCSENKVIQLSCQTRECGKAFLNAASVTYVVNGQSAGGGRWPWQVALLENNQFNCGGVIVNSRQIVTAAHCISSLSVKSYTIMAGSTKLQGTDANRIYRQVKTATLHGSFNYQFWYKGNDIAVLTLDGFLPFNNFIQPICLPETNDVFHSSSTCYSAGWGYTNYEEQTLPNDLQEAKLKITSREKCEASYASLSEGTICAGYDSGYIATCKGDSGGPLMCLGSNKRWKLAGVYVIFTIGCDVPDAPPVFTDVVHYLTWLNGVVVCEHQCANGRCIFTRDLCDGTDDCGDNTDEGVICSDAKYHGTSCTFENSFNCGYKNYTKGDYKITTRKQGAVADNKGPSADNTIGSSSGYYIYAATGPALFMGPAYKSDAVQCLTFYYLMRGASSTLQVVRHPLAQGTTLEAFTLVVGQKTVVQTIASTAATGIWQFAKVELPATASGVTSEILGFEFTGTAPNIALDDVNLVTSTCSAISCQETAFQCTDKSDCLPKDSKCNFVKECTDNSDESTTTCPPEKEKALGYWCSFEDINVCGIKQQIDEPSDWKLVPSAKSAETTGIANTGPPGHYFYTYTNVTTAVDTVSAAFSIDLQIRPVQASAQLCFGFSYWAETSGFLQVISVHANGSESITKLYESHQRQWTTRRIHLTYDAKKVLFKAYTTAATKTNFNFIAIDDITISHGSCECADDETFCADDIHCYKTKNLCLGQNECPDYSDNPLNCSCDASMSQFQCANGKCIPLNRKCNTNDDCGDESDERNCQMCTATNNDNFLCSDGYCLKKSFKCDGSKDCSNDEEDCCPAGQFQCTTKPVSCITNNKTCDGTSDCTDGSDELRCARLATIGNAGNVLQVRQGDEWHPVCSVGWNSELSASVCTLLRLGNDTASSASVALPAGQSYYTYAGIETTFKPHLFSALSNCSSNESVAMICSNSGPPCGFRNPEALLPVAFIIGGSLVTEGTWPWVGYLTLRGKYQCAGSLISDQWFITAAHCITNDSPSLHGVVLGSTKLDASTASVIDAGVAKIFKHANYSANTNDAIYTKNDIALVKLSTKVSFSLSVNRICLPEATETFETSDYCYLAGWGYSNPQIQEAVQDLRQLRTQIVANAECRTSTDAVIHDYDKQLCAGYLESVSGTKPSACNGDSGGALMCRKSGIWKVAGTVSWGVQDCDLSHPTVFTKVSYYKSWIESIMASNN